MGCDIHMFVEVKKNGLWEEPGKIFDYVYYDPEKESKIDNDGYEWNPKHTFEPYSGRNYDLFAILADVRNGVGFAGSDTGDGFKPISQPKGLPVDVSKRIQNDSNKWNGDGHSHSFFTVKELLDFDWSKKTKSRVHVKPEVYKKWKGGGDYYPCCAGASGPSIVYVSNEAMDKFIQNQELMEEGLSYYTIIEAEETYRDCVKYFLENTITTLTKLGKPEDVRIVFWFDN